MLVIMVAMVMILVIMIALGTPIMSILHSILSLKVVPHMVGRIWMISVTRVEVSRRTGIRSRRMV